ncbi:MAG: hypothetical protein O2955_02850 [Planctomycetota bacterium]|nr:hypothetical protein [Planctomycetota bacterium]MDA1211425.1 hypothetical protein [Planctomycetota bacterium]
MPIIVALFFVGTLIWMAFHGRWGSAYVVLEDIGSRSYQMDLNSQPLWDQPSAPTIADFTQHFSSRSLPDTGEITVYHKWSSWLLNVFMIWLFGSLVIAPVSFLIFRNDRALGAFARVGAGLIASAITCFLLWLAVGGWGPPTPLFFAVIGLVAGGIWAAAYAKKTPTAQGGPDKIGAAKPCETVAESIE